jgi:hypothetical protein
MDLHADLLGHLAVQALLQRLAGLDEAGQRAVHARHEVRRPRQQQLGAASRAAPDQGHHRRAQRGPGAVPAGRAAADAFAPHGFGGRAADPAVAVGAVPLDQLRGPSGESEQVPGRPRRSGLAGGRRRQRRGLGLLRQGHQRRAQRHLAPAGRRGRQAQRPAILAGQPSQVMAGVGPRLQVVQRTAMQHQRVAGRRHQPPSHEDEGPALGVRALGGVDGGMEAGAPVQDRG